MQKIKNPTVNQKDRIVCLSVPGKHKFFYQPYKSKERTYLFSTEEFSGSVFIYFRDNGRCLDKRGFSLTIKEIYEDRKMYRNPKIAKFFDRLPGELDKALRNKSDQQNQPKRNNKVKKDNKFSYEDYGLVA